MTRYRIAAASLLAFAFAASASAEDKKLKYPETKKVDQVDDYHGTKVPDPYRWLEDDVRKSTEVAAWVEAQNKVTQEYLAGIPQRDAIKKRITDLYNYEKISAPSKLGGGKYYFSKNDGLQNQSVLYIQDALDAEPKLLLDPNALSKDGTVALAGFVPSECGKYGAYGLAEAGSDWNTWKVLDLNTGKTLGDELKWVKFSGASWTADSRGFFYSRFAEPTGDAKFQATNENQKLYYHRLGTPQSEDVLVYERPDHPEWTISGDVTEDGRYLVVSIGDGTTSRRNRVAVKDLNEPYGLVTDLVANHDNKFNLVGNDGPVFYFLTETGSPKGSVIAVDIRKPAKENWKTVVAEAKETLGGVSFLSGTFVCNYMRDARSVVKVFATDGKHIRDVELPGIGTASGFGGKRTDTETFYTYSSFNTPAATYRYNVITGESKLFRQSKVKFDPAEYEVKQYFYPSKDGTKIPMFVAHKKGLKLDGKNPTLLYGYGGFNISLTPGFSVSRIQWMEMGGVLAVANLRGGGEYGEAWHKAGTKLQKQNVFDDFIAAAEFLIAEKYTSAKKIGIQGGSNGGLLVGACMAQRPELFGACLPAVGVMDMLRFQRFTAGRFWVDDYGDSANKDDFAAQFKYSPYHNLKPGTAYPPTLVTTADTDDRVVPGHSFKFTAMLQECHSGPNPVLARIETKAGHGAGKPTTKIIEEAADLWAFLVKNLDFEPTIPK